MIHHEVRVLHGPHCSLVGTVAGPYCLCRILWWHCGHGPSGSPLSDCTEKQNEPTHTMACWSLTRTSTSVRSMITIPSLNTVANKAKRAIYKDGIGSLDVTISVPQFAAVPGSSVPAARITQPIQISLVTNSLGKSGRKFSDDQARNIVTRWAQQVATAMPQGPGADSIHFR